MVRNRLVLAICVSVCNPKLMHNVSAQPSDWIADTREFAPTRSDIVYHFLSYIVVYERKGKKEKLGANAMKRA